MSEWTETLERYALARYWEAARARDAAARDPRQRDRAVTLTEIADRWALIVFRAREEEP